MLLQTPDVGEEEDRGAGGGGGGGGGGGVSCVCYSRPLLCWLDHSD